MLLCSGSDGTLRMLGLAQDIDLEQDKAWLRCPARAVG